MGEQHPGDYVRAHILPSGMSVTEAARLLGIHRTTLSSFLNGRSSLTPEMAARLERSFGVRAIDLIDLQRGPEAPHLGTPNAMEGARAFVPPFLRATANDIEAWADRHAARGRLAVFLRMLVHSTGHDLVKVDFPGNDDAERPGWDGLIEATTGTPWIPSGRSGWEFGTNKDVPAKATQDFAKAVRTEPKAMRADTTFVFVTPRRWLGKGRWQEERRAEGAWGDVRAYDASDLEQWLEQSIPAQVWFAGEQGRRFRGTRSLDVCWTAWNADCEHPFDPRVFDEARATVGPGILDKLKAAPDRAVKLAADSREEALAFLSTLFSTDNEWSASLRDRAVVFEETGPLSELAAESSRFLPIIADRAVERELAQVGVRLGGILIYPRNVIGSDADAVLEPLTHNAFEAALDVMGLGRDEADRLGHESGRSLTVLRRRLSQSDAVRRPLWSDDDELAVALVPFMLAGAWKASGDMDRYVLCHLAGEAQYENLERWFNRLLALDDSPVWAVGDIRGVISKLDALYAVQRHLTTSALDRFYEVAELVLAELDPALDLPEDQRWAAGMYGKRRDVSAALREGINESLVLLSVHGQALSGARSGDDPQVRSNRLVRKLLGSADTKTFESQAHDLPLYAEAAPEEFLRLLEADLRKPEPTVLALMRPVSDPMFSSTPRTGLLWALEGLAWSPAYLARVIDILARLAAVGTKDNLSNRPEATLASIFRSWMPQTGASLDQRLALLDRLARTHPALAWPICVDQFTPRSGIGHYSHKPRWRDDARGHGAPSNEGRREFVIKAIELALSWPAHDRSTLGDLIENIQGLAPHHHREVWDKVDRWAEQASDEDRASLREVVRVQTMTRRARRGRTNGLSPASTARARQAFKRLEPRDVVQKHAWLFRDHWVEESLADLDGDLDLNERDKRVEAERLAALSEVYEHRGMQGLLDIGKTGNASSVVGRIAASLVVAPEQRLELVTLVLSDGDVRSSPCHQGFLQGVFHALEREATFDIIRPIIGSSTDDMVAALLDLLPFDRTSWEAIAALGSQCDDLYWATVNAAWTRTDQDRDVAVERLLGACRPRAAFRLLGSGKNSVDVRTLYTILDQLPRSDEEGGPLNSMEAYHVVEAFTKLQESNAFGLDQMAQLEFVYLDVLKNEEGRLPNLERSIGENPNLFAEAVAQMYKRDDGTLEPEATLNEEAAKRASERAYRLLEALARVPGTGDDGQIDAEQLLTWIEEARKRGSELGRRMMCDYHVGQLLSHAPPDTDGVWPCLPVRDALDQVLNPDMEGGLTNALYNARGAHWRDMGGRQERALAAKYEGWARAQEHTHPRVAVALRRLASTYAEQARWEDDEAGVRKRLRY